MSGTDPAALAALERIAETLGRAESHLASIRGRLTLAQIQSALPPEGGSGSGQSPEEVGRIICGATASCEDLTRADLLDWLRALYQLRPTGTALPGLDDTLGELLFCSMDTLRRAELVDHREPLRLTLTLAVGV